MTFITQFLKSTGSVFPPPSKKIMGVHLLQATVYTKNAWKCTLTVLKHHLSTSNDKHSPKKKKKSEISQLLSFE
jgi:hypothetical protein